MSVKASLPDGIRIGDVLVGKYRVDGVLGAGGMGVVLAAYHVDLDEKVAIKVLSKEVADNAEAVARFQREARAAVKIKSEHVARVLDVGKLDVGAPFIVLEHLEGKDLAAWVEDAGPLSVPVAVDYVLQACEAIAEAHSLGIVHRDLKPSNLFCCFLPDGTRSIKVLDFGVSKMARGTSSRPDVGMTRTRSLLGSPLYMAPEQMKSSRQADPRSDIWSLGVVLFELVTGKAPFLGDEMPEVVLNIATADPLPLKSLLPDAPAELETAILRCLEKDPDRRFANLAELAVALKVLAPSSGASVERIERVTAAPRVPKSVPSTPRLAETDETVLVARDAPPQARTFDGQTSARRGTRDPFPTKAVVAVGVVLLASVVLAVQFLARPSAIPASIRTEAPSSATASEPEERRPPAPTGVPEASVPVDPAVASPVPPPPLDSALPSPSPSAAPHPSHRGVPAAKAIGATPDCAIPYYVDADGHKQYKPECLK